MKIQIQQHKVENEEEAAVQEYCKEENSLVYYHLARDNEIRQMREPRRFGYDFKLAFSYASYEELEDESKHF